MAAKLIQFTHLLFEAAMFTMIVASDVVESQCGVGEPGRCAAQVPSAAMIQVSTKDTPIDDTEDGFKQMEPLKDRIITNNLEINNLKTRCQALQVNAFGEAKFGNNDGLLVGDTEFKSGGA